MMQKDPTEAVRHAVRGMLPKGALGFSLLGKLRVYAGSEHPHVAQNPQPLP
jgi:large subunit ribosomal protein L13